jgi:stress response protein YsnF
MVRATNGASDDKAGREETAPIVEEELSIGKHEVASGGVRVTSSVEERPVEKTVSLREEKVEADRREADR